MPQPVLREMRVSDVPAVMAVQEPASIAGLSEVFPQDRHPFPREVLADRWHEEIADPGINCYVILRGSEVAGFAAAAGDEVKHFGVALDEWGEKLGWTDTGERSRGPMPPHAELLTYELRAARR